MKNEEWEMENVEKQTIREQGFLTHKGMIINRWQRNALRGQFNSAHWQRLGKQGATPHQRPVRAAIDRKANS